jgi:gamma-butyrobetaine dioxygenase
MSSTPTVRTTASELPMTNAARANSLDFPAIWLRANCTCQTCRDPGTGQSLFDITDVPHDVKIADVVSASDSVEIVFAPDGHRSTFTWAWLNAHRLDSHQRPDMRNEEAKELWRSAEIAARVPDAEWSAYLVDTATRARCLEAVLRLGFAILHGVPLESGSVLKVARSFGFARETNYGMLFDVRVEADPNNLAFTAVPLSPHTDNPYRDPVPTVQLLHCLIDAAAGGDSGLVDGFRAAAQLRLVSPDAFTTLCSTPVPFAFADDVAELSTDKPLIAVDPGGQIREVRFSNRHMQPLRMDHSAVVAFYASYWRFAELIYDPSARFTFKLRPGDCVIFDNTRVLHSRTAFDAAGPRHLQGCYADLDSLASTLAIIRRSLNC